MNPFILPIILMMYGEFSTGCKTRFISRVLFYSYTSSVLLPTYIIDHQQAILLGGVILVYGLGYCIVQIKDWLSRAALWIAAGLSFMTYTSLYLRDYAIVLQAPFIGDYSNDIFRACLLVAVTSLSLAEKCAEKDFKLEFAAMFLWATEYI
jgi:hypothetical protein